MVSGGFDPLHTGHLDLIAYAASIGDRVIVALNSDDWLIRKKGFAFMTWEERERVMLSLKDVDIVMPVDDTDDTVCHAIHDFRPTFFVNGGDRTPEFTPEHTTCVKLGVHCIYDEQPKVQSSSKLTDELLGKALAEVAASKPIILFERNWGHYEILAEGPGHLVKRVTINPGQSTSMQRHAHRTEEWHFIAGSALIDVGEGHRGLYIAVPHNSRTHHCFAQEAWHSIRCTSDYPLVAIEIWLGDDLREDDIERRDG